jgi:hypothetical protein
MIKRRFLSVPFLLSCSLSGCFLAGHTSSPWEYGGGVRLAPGLRVGSNEAVTVHPMAAYTYLKFDGGYDAIYEVGGQMRWRPRPARPNGGLWVGGEAAAARLSTSVSATGGYNASSSVNGWSLTGLVGAPVGSSRWGVNLYAGAGISHYGSQGKNVRAGVDVQPWFLKRSK